LDLRKYPTNEQRRKCVSAALGFIDVPVTITDCNGRVITITEGVIRHIAGGSAAHVAHAKWIIPTLKDPLEIWENIDPRKPKRATRFHYLSAYVGPDGHKNHIVVAVAANGILATGYPVDRYASCEKKRRGSLVTKRY
jgi:hypothetical protein